MQIPDPEREMHMRREEAAQLGGDSVREQVIADQERMFAQDSIYDLEHRGAWLFVLGAIIFGLIGALTGFGVIDLRSEAAAINIPGLDVNETAVNVLQSNFWDGALLIFAGITSAVLAFGLHMNDHHRVRDYGTMSSSESGIWSLEHSASYLFVLGAITLVTIGLLTGFGAFGSGKDQLDGLIWIWLGFGASIISTTLHAVRHHQTEIEEGYIIGLVEDRVGRIRFTTTGATEPGRQPMR